MVAAVAEDLKHHIRGRYEFVTQISVLCIGVDPGPTGGAVVVERQAEGGYRVVQRMAWAKKAPAMGDMMDMARSCTVAAVEGLYLGRAGAGVLAVAESAGAWLAAMPTHATMHRPMATTWQGQLLRVGGGAKSGDRDRAARQLVERLLGGVDWSCHECDAACMALWALGARGRRR